MALPLPVLCVGRDAAMLMDDCQITTCGITISSGSDVLPAPYAQAVLPSAHRVPPVSLARMPVIIDDCLIPARDIGIPPSAHPLHHIPSTGLARPPDQVRSECLISPCVPGQRRRQFTDRLQVVPAYPLQRVN